MINSKLSPGAILLILLVTALVGALVLIYIVGLVIRFDDHRRPGLTVIRQCEDQAICYLHKNDDGTTMSCIKDSELADKYCDSSIH